MKSKSCVLPSGKFAYGIHKPSFTTTNLRTKSYIGNLGETDDGIPVDNTINFPNGNLEEQTADWIYEVPNVFPFKGTTYINRKWAEEKAVDPQRISLPQPPPVSLSQFLKSKKQNSASTIDDVVNYLADLPEPILLALASTSTDVHDLVALAHLCCEFVFDKQTKDPVGIKFKIDHQGKRKHKIQHWQLFEVLANNFHLPEKYKEVMVLRPGIQGDSEIVGEWEQGHESHIFEYFRRNSYIPWGHFAANMANDAVRYRIQDLSFNDMKGLRHLYYQRTIVRLANELKIASDFSQKTLSEKELEELRNLIQEKLESPEDQLRLSFNRSLWGWNFGFDYAPSHYRLHASHQQIHQQYAMIPDQIPFWTKGYDEGLSEGTLDSYACGDLVEDFIESYQNATGKPFFDCFIKAIDNNERMDGQAEKPRSLIIHEQNDVLLFVPKAQTSQWELQIMTRNTVGNILEADTKTRNAIDRAIYIGVGVLSELGAKMITSIEYSKRFERTESDQRLLYSLLPRLPESPGAFSEAQLRWINGHYPEDFAEACRLKLTAVLEKA